MPSSLNRLSEEQAAEFLRAKFPGTREMSNAEILTAIADCRSSLYHAPIHQRASAEMMFVGLFLVGLGVAASHTSYFWPAVALLSVTGVVVTVMRTRSLVRQAVNEEFARRYGKEARASERVNAA